MNGFRCGVSLIETPKKKKPRLLSHGASQDILKMPKIKHVSVVLFIALLLIIFSLDLDAFASFQPVSTRIDQDPSQNNSQFPKIASDNNGHVYAIWKDDRPGAQNIYLNRSDDYGQTWQDFDEPIGFTDHPETLKIYSDNNGHVYVTWLQGTTVMLSRSQDFGQNWLSSGIAGPVSEGYDFTCNQDGHLVVSWNTNSNFELLANRSLDYGSTWLPQSVDRKSVV
jgi:hypothetical protein